MIPHSIHYLHNLALKTDGISVSELAKDTAGVQGENHCSQKCEIKVCQITWKKPDEYWQHTKTREWECVDIGLHECKNCRGDDIYLWHYACKFVNPNAEWNCDSQSQEALQERYFPAWLWSRNTLWSVKRKTRFENCECLCILKLKIKQKITSSTEHLSTFV